MRSRIQRTVLSVVKHQMISRCKAIMHGPPGRGVRAIEEPGSLYQLEVIVRVRFRETDVRKQRVWNHLYDQIVWSGGLR